MGGPTHKHKFKVTIQALIKALAKRQGQGRVLIQRIQLIGPVADLQKSLE